MGPCWRGLVSLAEFLKTGDGSALRASSTVKAWRRWRRDKGACWRLSGGCCHNTLPNPSNDQPLGIGTVSMAARSSRHQAVSRIIRICRFSRIVG